MDTNKRRFLLIAGSDYSKETWMLIPTDSIEVIEWVKGGVVTIYYRINGELYHTDVKQSFSDISNGKCTVEL